MPIKHPEVKKVQVEYRVFTSCYASFSITDMRQVLIH